MTLPGRILFVDVETTGLASADRVLSLGFVQLETAALSIGKLQLELGHYIFNPGRGSHPRARAVHGYSERVLRQQDPFTSVAADLWLRFEESDVVAAHNASFDRRFIDTEFALAGMPLRSRPFFCTMLEHRSRIGGRSGLDAVLANMGLARRGKTHGALEDAWMAMQVYLWLHDLPRAPVDAFPGMAPSNFRAVPSSPTASTPAVVLPPEPAFEPKSAPRRVDTEAQRRTLAASRATAVLMMWIARADGLVEQEVEAVFEMVGATMQRLGLKADPALQQDVAAALVDIEPTERLVDAAIRHIRSDKAVLEELGRWLKLVTYADGKGTEAERIAVARITAGFQAAKGS